MRVFVSTDFRGHYPVGTAAVIIANDKGEASDLLSKAMHEVGLDSDFTLDELDLSKPTAIILRDGDY